MTAKEIVTSHYPRAKAYRQQCNGPFGEVYWLIFEGYHTSKPIRLNDGEGCNTESKAWVQAKKNIQGTK